MGNAPHVTETYAHGWPLTLTRNMSRRGSYLPRGAVLEGKGGVDMKSTFMATSLAPRFQYDCTWYDAGGRLKLGLLKDGWNKVNNGIYTSELRFPSGGVVKINMRPEEEEGSVMSGVKRRVLKRKKHMLATNMEFDEELLELLREERVLTEEQFDDLKRMTSKVDRAFKFMEALPHVSGERFHRFMVILERDNVWLHDEILAEIRMEEGEMPLEDYVKEEAKMIVHRAYGSSKRFSEGDKRMIADLVASRAQTAKEAWKRQIDRAKREIEDLRARDAEKEAVVTKLNAKIMLFLRDSGQYTNHMVHDMRSTTEVLISPSVDSASPKDNIDRLSERLDLMSKRYARMLAEKESVMREAEKCYKALRCDDHKRPLASLLEETVGKLFKDKEDHEATLKSLKQKVINLEEELNRKDKLSDDMTREIDRLKSENRMLSCHVVGEAGPRSKEEVAPPVRGPTSLGDKRGVALPALVTTGPANMKGHRVPSATTNRQCIVGSLR